MLYSHRNETTPIHSNNDDHNKHNVEQKKKKRPKKHISYHFIHIKNKKQTKLIYTVRSQESDYSYTIISQRVWKGRGQVES